MKTRIRTRRRRAGFTLLEASIATAILVGILLGSIALMVRDDHLGQAALDVATAETRAQQMLARLGRELADARGENPIAVLTAGLPAADTGAAAVDSTLGFPDEGVLLVDRGLARMERIAYSELDAGGLTFSTLARGVGCSSAADHPAAAEVLWAGLAEPILIQTSPPPDLYDGRAAVDGQPVYYRGDGTGFSYRVPTDPAGGTNYLDEGAIRWGATVGNVQLATGWVCVVFAPVSSFSEPASGQDLNRDGDRLDVFDVGQLRRRAWDTADPTKPATTLGLGPSVVVQERCHPGADLDHDGFQDPIFLWDEASHRLHVRLFVLGSTAERRPVMRKVEATIFLRNDPG